MKFSFSEKQTIFLLRICLSLVFLWFGALKIFGVSPVVPLIQQTYPLLPQPAFITILGFGEIIIGIGLLIRTTIRYALILFFLQMTGIFLGLLLVPSLYFQQGNFLLLTLYGEFVIKNIVLVSAGIVIWKHIKQ